MRSGRGAGWLRGDGVARLPSAAWADRCPLSRGCPAPGCRGRPLNPPGLRLQSASGAAASTPRGLRGEAALGNAGRAGAPWACDLRGFCPGVSGSPEPRGRPLLPSGPLANALRPGIPSRAAPASELASGPRALRPRTLRHPPKERTEPGSCAASLQRAWVCGDPVHSCSACQSILKRFEALPCSVQSEVIEISDRRLSGPGLLPLAVAGSCVGG